MRKPTRTPEFPTYRLPEAGTPSLVHRSAAADLTALPERARTAGPLDALWASELGVAARAAGLTEAEFKVLALLAQFERGMTNLLEGVTVLLDDCRHFAGVTPDRAAAALRSLETRGFVRRGAGSAGIARYRIVRTAATSGMVDACRATGVIP